MFSKTTKIAVSAAVVILLLWALCFRVVGVGRVGILTQFGKIQSEKQSGVVLKLPWQGFTQMNVQVQKEQQTIGAATQDLQLVNTTVAVNYHLTPNTADDIFRSVGVTYKTTVIDPIISETVKSVTSQYNATDLIDQRPKVATQTFGELSTALVKRGITVDNLSIVDFEFSSDFSKAIEQKQVAAQNVLEQQYRLQAATIQAQANQAQTAALTPAILQQQAIAKWDGKLPANTLQGGSTVFNIPLQ